MSDSDLKNALPAGTVLHFYTIDCVLGHGGFGIVYKGHHQELGAVAIKEYLPPDLAVRQATEVHPLSEQSKGNYDEGLRRFVEEAKQLIQFNHPNIVRCRDFIRAHGTAYLVMDFEDGLPLSDLIRLREHQNNAFSEAEIKRIIYPLLEGLEAVHSYGVLHRDIKPGNIFIRRSTEQPVLIDFGAAKQNFSEHSKSLAPYSPGYAAIEQIEEQGNLGPWTDIYALGAVMWRMVAGENPPPVEKRTNALIRGKQDSMTPANDLNKGGFSRGFLNAIDHCLNLREEDRFQTIQALKSALDNDEFSPQASAHTDSPASENRQQIGKTQKVPRKVYAGALAVLILSAGAFSYWAYYSDSQPSAPLTAQVGEIREEPETASSPISNDATAQAEVDEQTEQSTDAEAPGQTNADAETETETAQESERLAVEEQERLEAERERLARESQIEAKQQRLESPALRSLAGEMVRISGGSFQMGDRAGVGEVNELPLRSVEVADFYIGRHEVTLEQFAHFADATGYRTEAESSTRDDGHCHTNMNWRNPGFFQTPDHPVGCLSFNDVMAFIDWLSAETGINFRLPSEAEWEYAARGNTNSSWFFGNSAAEVCDYGNVGASGNCDDGFTNTSRVGTFEPNPFNLYDMLGNVYEYVADCWHESYDEAPHNAQAWNSEGCESRVIRGGAYTAGDTLSRSSARARHPTASDSHASDGFRLATDIID